MEHKPLEQLQQESRDLYRRAMANVETMRLVDEEQYRLYRERNSQAFRSQVRMFVRLVLLWAVSRPSLFLRLQTWRDMWQISHPDSESARWANQSVALRNILTPGWDE